MPRRLDPRARLLGGARDDGIEQHPLFRELDLAENHWSRREVVGEPADLLQLPFDHRIRRMLDGRTRAIVGADDLESVAHGCQRVAQLVRKHREELALAAAPRCDDAARARGARTRRPGKTPRYR